MTTPTNDTTTVVPIFCKPPSTDCIEHKGGDCGMMVVMLKCAVFAPSHSYKYMHSLSFVNCVGYVSHLCRITDERCNNFDNRSPLVLIDGRTHTYNKGLCMFRTPFQISAHLKAISRSIESLMAFSLYKYLCELQASQQCLLCVLAGLFPNLFIHTSSLATAQFLAWISV